MEDTVGTESRERTESRVGVEEGIRWRDADRLGPSATIHTYILTDQTSLLNAVKCLRLHGNNSKWSWCVTPFSVGFAASPFIFFQSASSLAGSRDFRLSLNYTPPH